MGQEQFAQDLEMDLEALELELVACLQAPSFDPTGAPMEEQHLALELWFEHKLLAQELWQQKQAATIELAPLKLFALELNAQELEQ